MTRTRRGLRRPVDVDASAAIGIGGCLAGCVAAVIAYAATGNVLVAVPVAVVGSAGGIAWSDAVSDSHAYQQRAARHRLRRR